METMIQVNELTKVFKTDEVETWALDKVNIEIGQGEFVAVMGPSGCGKSTLLHILGLLDSPSSGQYLLDGKDVSSCSESKRNELRKGMLGFVFQSFNLIDELTDRYGDPPRPVTALLDVALLRAAAADTGGDGYYPEGPDAAAESGPADGCPQPHGGMHSACLPQPPAAVGGGASQADAAPEARRGGAGRRRASGGGADSQTQGNFGRNARRRRNPMKRFAAMLAVSVLMVLWILLRSIKFFH